MIKLHTQIIINAPKERCFDLARSVEAHAATARTISGKAVAGRVSGLSAPGDWTTWSARFFGMRFRLTTEISAFEYPHSFSDTLRSGIFTHFGHVYTLEDLGGGQTRLTDAFSFQSPCGPLGTLIDRVVLRGRMKWVDEARAEAIKRIAESEEWKKYLQ